MRKKSIIHVRRVICCLISKRLQLLFWDTGLPSFILDPIERNRISFSYFSSHLVKLSCDLKTMDSMSDDSSHFPGEKADASAWGSSLCYNYREGLQTQGSTPNDELKAPGQTHCFHLAWVQSHGLCGLLVLLDKILYMTAIFLLSVHFHKEGL